MKIKLKERTLTLTEIILLRNLYKEKLDKIMAIQKGFNETNNDHRLVEERFQILDQAAINQSNQIDWEEL